VPRYSSGTRLIAGNPHGPLVCYLLHGTEVARLAGDPRPASALRRPPPVPARHTTPAGVGSSCGRRGTPDDCWRKWGAIQAAWRPPVRAVATVRALSSSASPGRWWSRQPFSPHRHPTHYPISAGGTDGGMPVRFRHRPLFFSCIFPFRCPLPAPKTRDSA